MTKLSKAILLKGCGLFLMVTAQFLWRVFEETGSIVAYLAYREIASPSMYSK